MKYRSSSSTNAGFNIRSLLYNPKQNQNNYEQLCIGGWNGEIQLYEIQQQQQIKLVQTFPQEHTSFYYISC